MTNPFSKNNGFNNRLRYARENISAYGRDQNSQANYNNVFNNRKFDDCFENGDGNAIVYAIMHEAYTKSDHDLLIGISAIGTFMKWKRFYDIARNNQVNVL